MEWILIILKLIFFLSLLGILHTYVFYPLVMRFMGIFVPKPEAGKPEKYPSLEIIFAAYNEESVIEQKILSSLQSEYPAEKLSIRVGSDASTDNTDLIIQKLQKKFTQVHFKRFEARTGKSSIINQLVQESTAEIIVLTDANIIFNQHTLPRLIKSLENPKAGIVGGHILYRKPNGQGISLQEDLYLRWENALKKAESRLFGKAMGVEGGCYAVRRELFPGIPPRYYMEDFYISLSVMQRGFQVLFNEQAECFEDVSTQSSEEYKRKVRISIGNFQNLHSFGKIIFTRFFPTGFMFLSHKVLRWLTPFFLLTLLITTTILAPVHLFFALFAGVYMMMIGLGLFGILFSQNKFAGILKYPGHFIHMNLALLEGFLVFIKGVESNVWQPTRRNQN